jgi:hypothetical protein
VGARAAPELGSKAWWEGVLVRMRLRGFSCSVDRAASPTHNMDDAGCRRMWAAVVYQAVKDMEYETGRRPAINWMYSDRTGVGSMRWICDMLDLDYYKLTQLCMTRAGRARILRWNGSGDGDGKKSPRSMKRG